MSRTSGLRKIARFNWPFYAAGVATTAAGIYLLQSGALHGPWPTLAAVGLFWVAFWLLASLVVSHYVYDRSAVSRGGWLDGVDGVSVQRAAVFHAGQDEASDAVARALPTAALQTFDFYDPERNGTRSLRRARELAGPRGVPISPDEVPLGDGVLDLGLIVFAAHEIRRDEARAAFFQELVRTLAPSGRLIVVEHLRDGWNFLAYGPGAFHFLSRKTWCRSFAGSGLMLLREAACTPFVRVFELGKAR